MSDDQTICTFCKGPVLLGPDATIYECVNCLTRWCEQCEGQLILTVLRQAMRAAIILGKFAVGVLVIVTALLLKYQLVREPWSTEARRKHRGQRIAR